MESELLYSSNTESITENEEIHSSLPISITENALLHNTSIDDSAIKSELLHSTYQGTIVYRGITINFSQDPEFLQLIAEFNGTKLPLGYASGNYREDVEHVIDLQLDTICQFEDMTPYARLLFFDNYTNKDIKLVYRGRILKIYPIFDEKSLNLAEIKKDSEKVLKKVLKLEKFQLSD